MITYLRQTRYLCTKPFFETDALIYSCKARDKVPLNLPSNAITSFYTCGPTVYDSAHIGHASCYVRLDIIQRILRNHFRLNLVTAMNITDIDDKIIKRAELQGKAWHNISKHFELEFWGDLQRLNVKLPDIKLRVTDHIPSIVSFIEKLVISSFAYSSIDGSIYFDSCKYPQYGKLQNVPTEAAPGEGKKNAADFALWKAAKPGEPSWDSPFGKGRPGWHIECSTLASHIFGERLDFHAGGMDLRFPHHENEEAQSCCYHRVDDWVSYWIHTGQLHVEGQQHKMSKSLKNTISVSDLLQRFSTDEFRMLCLLSHYRNSIDFGNETMTVATSVLKKFHSFLDDTKAYVTGVRPACDVDASSLHCKLDEAVVKIDGFLKNDFNTAGVITTLGELSSEVHKSINQKQTKLTVASESGSIQAVSNYIRQQLLMFGLVSMDDDHRSDSNESNGSTERIIESVVQIRNSIRSQAMSNKDPRMFAICDQIRDQLKEMNVEIKDHGKISSWSFTKR
ncbi:probable cysteine--tRNA ligase, mitochondrial [Toxorhynchites rutilus septentrionalis]|uniref:probable cysteine--tRNA ligase, mitochondrial n=1 Tax=Toxorhynchites rutilus septentrionalis TaxID=329112 RepID=UPI00247B0604|nr:probable cysteine--tRNA ligase, mitochondrial [Toxorhynchites rutilus septentrionalis]